MTLGKVTGVVFCIFVGAISTGQAATPLAMPNEVIVKFKAQRGAFRTLSTTQSLYSAFKVEDVSYLGESLPEYEVWHLQPGQSMERVLRSLQGRAEIEFAQPNYILAAPEVIRPLQEPPGGGEGGFPCIPGFEIPGCDPNAAMPCLIPGLPFPPGCSDESAPVERPIVNPVPTEPAAAADPNLNDAWGIGNIHANEAWATQKGSKSVIVAVIDTGIDYNHEDLAFNIWRNPNPTNNDTVGYDFTHNDGLPFDDQGHGTHTSGTVGAVGNNGIGVSGVAQRVSIMGVKFLSANGQGTTAGAVQSIDYAVAHGAKILSNSWGGPADAENQTLADAIERARQQGVLFVVAAGNESKDNDGPEASYPAAFPHDNIISVAATGMGNAQTNPVMPPAMGAGDKLSFFSNYGRNSVDLGAPGERVYSLAPGGGYETMDGTSMACPHVAGAAAVVWAQHPEWDYKKVRQALLQSVDPQPSLQGKTVTGGRLNLKRALEVVIN